MEHSISYQEHIVQLMLHSFQYSHVLYELCSSITEHLMYLYKLLRNSHEAPINSYVEYDLYKVFIAGNGILSIFSHNKSVVAPYLCSQHVVYFNPVGIY